MDTKKGKRIILIGVVVNYFYLYRYLDIQNTKTIISEKFSKYVHTIISKEDSDEQNNIRRGDENLITAPYSAPALNQIKFSEIGRSVRGKIN